MPSNSGNYSVTAYFTSPVTTLVCTSMRLLTYRLFLRLQY
jgi:hypothetical protein